MKTMLKYLLVLTLAISFSATAYSKGNRRFEKEIEQIMKENAMVGLEVGVIRNGKLVYTKAFGYSEVETRTPLKEDAVCRMASVSKSFSAVAVKQLEEQGKLSLGDDISDLLGFEVRNPYHKDVPITVEMLLSHTSSIQRDKGRSNLNLLKSGSENIGDYFYKYAPGEKYNYSNTGFNLIGAIIEKVSGERFDCYMRRHVLRPMGMNDSDYHNDSIPYARKALIYRVSKGRLRRGYTYPSQDVSRYSTFTHVPVFSPCGGLCSTVEDLSKYIIMHLNGGVSVTGERVLSEQSEKDMLRGRVKVKKGYYCLGLVDSDVWTEPGVNMIHHSGSSFGLKSGIGFIPEEKFGMIMICNGYSKARTKKDPHLQDIVMKCIYRNFHSR